jgi:hypothetical protein
MNRSTAQFYSFINGYVDALNVRWQYPLDQAIVVGGLCSEDPDTFVKAYNILLKPFEPNSRQHYSFNEWYSMVERLYETHILSISKELVDVLDI